MPAASQCQRSTWAPDSGVHALDANADTANRSVRGSPGRGFGLVASLSNVRFDGPVDNRAVQLLPPADQLNIPPDLLELWAQVAVRGCLDERGAFVPWDEQTWEKKRRELAAKPAPYSDFPFPGYVATDMNQHQGYRSVEQGATAPVRLATLPPDGPTGGYFNSRKPVAW